jgi:hypothetical protein
MYSLGWNINIDIYLNNDWYYLHLVIFINSLTVHTQ